VTDLARACEKFYRRTGCRPRTRTLAERWVR
jgi:hypothetical protein